MSQPAGERHRLLERQLRKARDASGALDLERLLDMVAAAYTEQDESRRLNDHAVRLMSSELNELYAKVRADAAQEAHHTEARLYALLENIADGALVLDGQGRIIAFNAAAEAMFGRRREDVTGKAFLDLRLIGCGDIARFVASGVSESGAEVQGCRADGEAFTAEITQAHMSIDGEPRRVTLWRDITARKAAEEALRKARDEARAASQAKSEFLATMSHEIRTPLNGVLGTAGALGQTKLTAEQAQMVKVMLESGELLTTILSDILDLAKIEAGRLELEMAPFEPGAMLNSVVELFHSTATAKGLTLTTELGEGLNQVAAGDAGRLRQVVQNLLSNALKFTAEGSVTLRAWLEDDSAGLQPKLCIEVVDTGLGVPAGAQARLFTRFSQADSSTTRRFGGTGLGLALCRELIGAMGGDIGMRSREGGGSIFWLKAPLQLDGVAPVEAEDEFYHAPRSVAGMRVLGVDDNATNRFVLRAVLEAAGCVVQLAENGEEAVRVAAENDFDAILMDIHMPVLDGLGATRAIRNLGGRHLNTPIIAVTAEALPEQIERARLTGMNHHVTKPIRPDRLLEVLGDAVRDASARGRAQRVAEAG